MTPAQKAPAPKKPATAKTTPAKAVPGYVPGAKPSLAGIYVVFEAPAEALVMQLEELEKPAPEPENPWRHLTWTRAALTLALLGLSLGSCGIDQALGFRTWVFAALTPFAWLGVVLVFAATRPPGPRPAWIAGGVGCLGGAVLIGLLAFSTLVVDRSTPSLKGWIIGTAITLAVAWLFGRSGSAVKADTAVARGRLGVVRAVVQALADDVAPGKRPSGWLDLTGADQPGKLMREAQARSGAKVQLYRDEWWRLRLPLRDGNDLRVSGVDRVKARRDHYKRNARGKNKLKPGRMETLSTLEVRLAVNPAVYAIKAPSIQALRVGQLTLPAPTSTAGALSYVVPVERFAADEALGVLAALYSQLEPVARPAGS